MCGRFTQKYNWEELHRPYRLTQPARNVQPQYNIGPTDPIDVIIPGWWAARDLHHDGICPGGCDVQSHTGRHRSVR